MASLTAVPERPQNYQEAEECMPKYCTNLALSSYGPTHNAYTNRSGEMVCCSCIILPSINNEGFLSQTPSLCETRVRVECKDPARLLGKSGEWVAPPPQTACWRRAGDGDFIRVFAAIKSSEHSCTDGESRRLEPCVWVNLPTAEARSRTARNSAVQSLRPWRQSRG